MRDAWRRYPVFSNSALVVISRFGIVLVAFSAYLLAESVVRKGKHSVAEDNATSLLAPFSMNLTQTFRCEGCSPLSHYVLGLASATATGTDKRRATRKLHLGSIP